MSDDVLEQYIRQLIEAHRTDHVNIAWQGDPACASCTRCRLTARC
jgi:hypothetical protein